MKLMDETQTTDLFKFSSLSTGTGKLNYGSSNSSFQVALQKNETSGDKAFITHKRGIKNRRVNLSLMFRGASRTTNRDSFRDLVEAQTTVYLDAESDADLEKMEGLYDFDGIYSEFIDKKRNLIAASIGLFENKNDD